MTIGQYDYDLKAPNPDFLTLAKCRQDVCENLNLDIKQVELSMGMSSDFEHAVSMSLKNLKKKLIFYWCFLITFYWVYPILMNLLLIESWCLSCGPI